MKFRLPAAIALYFLLTLLFTTLSTTSSREKHENVQIFTSSTQSNLLQNHIHAPPTWFANLEQEDKDNMVALLSQGINHYGSFSKDVKQDLIAKFRIDDLQTEELHEFVYHSREKHENRRKVFAKKWQTFSQLLIGIHKPRITQTSLLPQRKNNILSLIINQFLTCKDIIVLQQTCYDFQHLLHPNDAHMVSFLIYGLSKTMTDTNIIWEDLKYFMKQNYYSAFYEMKMKVFNKRESAWAMITKEGNVITGGNQEYGGDSSIVQSQLRNVKKIFSTYGAFATLLDNGTVVAWGNEAFGGKIPDEIQTQLENVKTIFSTNYAFVALLDNGTVVAWGNEDFGGKILRNIQNKMSKNVKMIFSTNVAFSALLNDGTVVAWGRENEGGKIPNNIQTQLIDVKQIIPTQTKFTALCKNGKRLSWGHD